MAELKERTIKKEFVPYDLALELKELGFDEPCNTCYDKLQMVSSYGKNVFDYKNYNTSVYVVSRPTFSQAFRFFREKYMLSGEIYIFKNIWNFDIEDISNSIQLYTSDIMCYNSYEEAELECLVKLIDIVKRQNVK